MTRLNSLWVVFIFGLVAFHPSPAASAENLPFACLVVSGLKHDDNRALSSKSEILTSGTGLRDPMPCRVFETWLDLEIYANALELPHQLLLLHGAHGSPGGGIRANRREDSADEMISIFDRLSTHHRVGALLLSCYSGDLVVEKLAREEREYRAASAGGRAELERRLRNQCLAVASVPAYPALPDPREPTLEPRDLLSVLQSNSVQGKSLEEIFRLQPQGMISSGAYSETGIAALYADREKFAGEAALSAVLQPYLRPEYVRNNGAKSSDPQGLHYRIAKLVQAGKVSAAVTHEWAALLEFEGQSFLGYRDALENVLRSPTRFARACRLTHFPTRECASLARCVQGYVSFLAAAVGENQRMTWTLERVHGAREKFRASAEARECRFATEQGRSAWAALTEDHFIPLYASRHRSDPGPFHYFMQNYVNALEKFNRRFGTHFRGFQDSVEALEGDGPEADRLRPTRADDTSLRLLYAAEPRLTALGDGNAEDSPTQILLSSFMTASFARTEFRHPLDRARREGCRGFIIPRF